MGGEDRGGGEIPVSASSEYKRLNLVSAAVLDNRLYSSVKFSLPYRCLTNFSPLFKEF